MITTRVFSKNLASYTSGQRLVINQGGTSSSKTYSILQLLYLIALNSEKPLILSVVSYALPHLKLGAVRDFESILIGEGFILDRIRNKTDLTYRLGLSTIEFFSVDNMGKVHGPRRDVLYVNEANHIKSLDVFTQLSIRTKGCIFLDYNPTQEFWAHTEVMPNQQHAYIQSTYKDNHLLDAAIVQDIEARKHNENWWRVYGLGETGQLEGAILKNWSFGEFDHTLPYGFGLDFGFKDPDAMVRVAIDRRAKKLYWKEELYKRGLSSDQLSGIVSTTAGQKMVVADSANPRNIADLRRAGLNVRPVKKNRITDDVKLISDFEIIVDPNSYNLSKELNSWVWLDKKGEVPIDDFNHLIDAARYVTQTMLAPGRTKGLKLVR